MIFDSITSENFITIKFKKKTIADLSYVIYTCSIEDLNFKPPYKILVPISQWQMHRLIPMLMQWS